MFCRLLFVLLHFVFWPLCCLFFFDIWILITPLVSSNNSYTFYRSYFRLQRTTWSIFTQSSMQFFKILSNFNVLATCELFICYYIILWKVTRFKYIQSLYPFCRSHKERDSLWSPQWKSILYNKQRLKAYNFRIKSGMGKYNLQSAQLTQRVTHVEQQLLPFWSTGALVCF